MISVQILVVETNNASNNLVIAEVTKRFLHKTRYEKLQDSCFVLVLFNF